MLASEKTNMLNRLSSHHNKNYVLQTRVIQLWDLLNFIFFRWRTESKMTEWNFLCLITIIHVKLDAQMGFLITVLITLGLVSDGVRYVYGRFKNLVKTHPLNYCHLLWWWSTKLKNYEELTFKNAFKKKKNVLS